MPSVKANGINIYYELRGNPDSDNVVVFMNGVLSSIDLWKNQISLFEKLGFKILLHDYRGQLLSDKPEGAYSFDIHVEDLKALLDELKIENAHIIGISYGGIISQRFTLKYPKYVRTLSLLNTLSGPDQFAKFRQHGAIKHITSEEDINGEIEMLQKMPTYYGEEFIAKNDKKLIKFVSQFNKVDNDFYKAQISFLQNMLNDDFDEHELSKIKCPVLIIGGGEDILYPLKYSKRIAENIQHSEYVVLPKSGHVSIIEKPNEVNTLLKGFILKYI